MSLVSTESNTINCNFHIKPDDTNDFYNNHSTFHDGDSGLDLFFPEQVVVKARETKLVGLGIRCEARTSYFLMPRSSIYKTPLRMANSIGLIDRGYRGELMVPLDNNSDQDYTIEKGQRLFQICLPSLESIYFKLVDELSETSRGEGGFGSTNN